MRMIHQKTIPQISSGRSARHASLNYLFGANKHPQGFFVKQLFIVNYILKNTAAYFRFTAVFLKT